MLNKLNIPPKALLTPLSLLCMFMMPVVCGYFLWGMLSLTDLIVVALASLPLCFLLSAVRPYWLFVLLSLILMYTSGNETFVVVVYHNYMKAANVISMMLTTSNESGSFISNNTTVALYDVPVVIFEALALWARKKTPYLPLHQLAAGCATLIVALLLIGPAKLISNPPYDLPWQYADAWLQQKEKETCHKQSIGKEYGAKRTEAVPADTVKEIYVLSIGESCVIDHLSLAGYERKTTPCLDKRAKDLTLFTDYYSNSNLTILSVPMLMSHATADDFFTSYSDKNILKAFKECGFSVFVLSCKNHLDDDPFLTYDADSVFHLQRDIDIPTTIDSLANHHGKILCVTEILGNHCYYYNFEAEDNLFHPNPYDAEFGFTSENAEKADEATLLNNAYDNTIHYTDRVLDSVITVIDRPNTQTVFLYVSDHGENLEPGAEKRSMSMNPKSTEYHVPLIYWSSESWQYANTVKHNNIHSRGSKPIGADNVFHTLIDCAGIVLPEKYNTAEWSLASDNFTLHPRTLLTPDGRTARTLK